MNQKNLVAWYQLNDKACPGKDASGHGKDAKACGAKLPVIEEVNGRMACSFAGGPSGTSYLELPADVLSGIGDQTGFTVSAWVCNAHAENVWERIFDFGHGMTGPYVFLTRFFRGVCFKDSDIPADAGRGAADGEWTHVALTVTGTQGGTLSSAGPRLYVNGELVSDGFISQTSSGTYKALREWLATFDDPASYDHNYIARSQFAVDADYHGAVSDFRIYKEALSEEDILGMMCEVLEPAQILSLARTKFLPTPAQIITSDLQLPSSLMDGRVQVDWSCDKPSLIGKTGQVSPSGQPEGVRITARLSIAEERAEKVFTGTVMPAHVAPYEITVHADRPVLDISKTLYGLFYEDINHAADGGIYAEMIQNRSFEEFTFRTYDPRSGEHGHSDGRNRTPLRFWFGDLDRVEAKLTGGLNEHLGLTDPEANACYLHVSDGTKLQNRGYCDNKEACSMNLVAGDSYLFSIWIRSSKAGSVKLHLMDAEGKTVSNSVVIMASGDGQWTKHYAEPLVAQKTVLGQIELEFSGEMDIDMVSLFPAQVWGASEENASASAHSNYMGNPNYRLRRDLVEALVDLHPSFLRFPGGCISEGSYIWDNVYDWKDSVGDVERRKENFNVWGYGMTMGLGYMEYFQLAEDLGATPLPVMACGVLCQARSDYANPAGGKLRDKYIKNFTDLIDFAISTDFENNEWAKLRRQMGHEMPFDLHLLGVGNENWGTEFYANFEAFQAAIDEHMKKHYPGYDLTIISTAGAQADDDAYQQGWKYLSGHLAGGDRVAFSDGEKAWEENVTWYSHQENFLDTIVDEHYYRSNDYLLENADRYNYYYRPYEDGMPVEKQISKVFVGEYASSDKNTLAGAIAEAAVMTGFEKNSDVVRLAATAPLFNKVGTDGTYRWTPDAIWFDDTTVWRTPNYYVQQMFAQYLGDKLLETSYAHYADGKRCEAKPAGGISIRKEGAMDLKKLTVSSYIDGRILFEQDFTQPLSEKLIPTATGYYLVADWTDYKVTLLADKKASDAYVALGVGLNQVSESEYAADKLSVYEYCVGVPGDGTGLRVVKNGKEGYTMGDYATSHYAGNLRACFDQEVACGELAVTVDFKACEHAIHCEYSAAGKLGPAVLDYKLESYNRDVYHAATTDAEHIYLKLVNADAFDKRVKLTVDAAKVDKTAQLVTLTGAPELVHVPNVNTKDAELVVPTEQELAVAEETELVLPADSVSVLIYRRA